MLQFWNFCETVTYTAWKTLKEHLENTSDLNGKKIKLDIYTDMGKGCADPKFGIGISPITVSDIVKEFKKVKSD